MANGRESRRPVRLLSSSPSSLRRSLVFFFILRRPRYTSGERLQTRSSRTVGESMAAPSPLQNSPVSFSLFFFLVSSFKKDSSRTKKRNFSFSQIRKDRNYMAILCEIQLLSIIESYFWIYTYVLVWFYPEEDNSIQ